MNLCMLTDCPLSAEALKASQCPVPGAVVIAPLTESVRNYGSLGGSFTVVGAPVLAANGATFDRVDDVMYIDSGSSANFSLVFLAKLNAVPAGAFEPLAHVMGDQTGTGSAGWAVFVATSSAKYQLNPVGGAVAPGLLDYELNSHVFTLTRASGTTSMYIDGVWQCSTALGTSGKIRLWVGGSKIGPWYLSKSTIANAVLYHSALSAPDQAAVEAYVAAP